VQERGIVASLSDRAGPEASETPRGTSHWRLAVTLGVAAVVVAADQATKSVAVSHLGHPVHVLGPFGLSLGYNSGAAFSLFTGAPLVLAGVAVILVGILLYLAWRATSAWLAAAIGLILGGALGNLADRAFRGHRGDVVDFITLTHWPTFNVADAAITVGIMLVLVLWLVPVPMRRRADGSGDDDGPRRVGA